MNTVACPSCNSVNSTDESVCAKCGDSLIAAKIQQSVDELKRLTDKFQQANAPSFYSFNGFGTTLLDYRALPDGTYEATRWVIALFLPVFPLSAYVIQPTVQERSYGRETSRFSIVGQTPLSAARILRTYLLAVIGVAPVVIGVAYADQIGRVVKGLWALPVMVLGVAWAVYFIFFKLKNDSQAYKSKAAS
ncbi:MAG TPA: zinc ribbon domain-containing protein [Pyrinomonadaceae bacterium]|nr:zinc ribbon domain-containing protein [Pyrinomonadaceae bacterium]